MSSKKVVLVGTVLAMLALGLMVAVQAEEDNEMGGRSCNPTGLWFGFPQGQPPFKVVSILPVAGGKQRYVLAAEDQDPADTPFRGEMVRIKEGHYKLWGIQYFSRSSETYGYMVVSGEWSMSDCDTAEGDYLVSLYDMDPFHTEGAAPFYTMEVLNVYERVPRVDDSSNF